MKCVFLFIIIDGKYVVEYLGMVLILVLVEIVDCWFWDLIEYLG